MTQHDAESTHFLTARVILKAKETRRLKKKKKIQAKLLRKTAHCFKGHERRGGMLWWVFLSLLVSKANKTRHGGARKKHVLCSVTRNTDYKHNDWLPIADRYNATSTGLNTV